MKQTAKRNVRQRLTAAAFACVLAVSAAGCGESETKISDTRTYDVENYVTLGDYKAMTVAVAGSFEVTDEDVKDSINSVLKYYPAYEELDKTTVEDGDFVDIDYEGKKDGVAFEGGTAEGYVLEIGSGTFIDGFEDGLIGVNVGDTVDLDLTFPENYQSEELAGAAVVFTVTVNKIVEEKAISYDDLTDEYVAENLNYESVETMYNETKEYLLSNNEQSRSVAERQAVLDKLIEISKIAVPDGLLDEKVKQYTQQFTAQNCSDGTELEDFLSENYHMTTEEFETTITNELQSNLNDELVLEALANAEGETLDEDGFSEYVASAMQSGNYETEDDLYAAYDSDYEDGKTYLERRYLLTSALGNLVEKCKFTYSDADTSEES